jgi:hypothetical protein
MGAFSLWGSGYLEVVNLHDIGMMQRSDQPRFALEA